jgi:hypothetical protein
VSIVHVPVGAAAVAATKIYWTLDRAVADESEFCNLTSNRIEVRRVDSILRVAGRQVPLRRPGCTPR